MVVYYKKDVSPDFIEYCNLFYNKFKNNEINLENGRTILSYHKFEGRTNRTRDGMTKVIEKFLSGSSNCEVVTMLDISKYCKENIKKISKNNLSNVDISQNEYKEHINIILGVDIEDINEFYNKDYRYRTKYVTKNISNIIELMEKCNNKIPNKKIDFFAFIISMAKKKLLIFNYTNSRTNFNCICNELHIESISKSCVDDRINLGKNICRKCEQNTEHNNKINDIIDTINDYLKSIKSHLINYNPDTKIVSTPCPKCKNIEDISFSKLFSWKCCYNCNNEKVNIYLLQKGIYKFTYNPDDKIVCYNCPCCYKIISTKIFILLHNNILCYECQIYTYMKSYNNIVLKSILNDKEFYRTGFNSYNSTYNKKELDILNKYNIDIPNINKFSTVIKNIKYEDKYQSKSKEGIHLSKIYNDEVIINTTSINKTYTSYIPALYLKSFNTYIDIRCINEFYKESNVILTNFSQSVLKGYKVELWLKDENYIYCIYYYDNNYWCKTGHDISSFYLQSLCRYTQTIPILKENLIVLGKETRKNVFKLLSLISYLQYTRDLYQINTENKILEDNKNIDEPFYKGRTFMEIISYIEKTCKNSINIPIPLVKKISQMYFVDIELFNEIIDTISINLPTFPKIKIDYEIMRGDYGAISSSTLSIIDNNIKSNTTGYKILNNFFLESMLTARKKGNPTIYEEWDNIDKRKCLLRRLFIQGKAGNRITKKKVLTITPQNIVQTFGCSKDRVYNFSPTIAKSIYNYFNAKKVLDFCAGYGGRLLGFWFSNAASYTGIDPNDKNNYQSLINWLRIENKIIKKDIKIIQQPAEDVDFKKLGTFDFIFTSPPYFDVEIYSDEPTQSCIRYSNYQIWLEKFLFTVLLKCIEVLDIKGILAINIKNLPEYKIADDMNKFLSKINVLERKDDIIMVQPSRPQNVHNSKTHEKIYVYKKYKNDF